MGLRRRLRNCMASPSIWRMGKTFSPARRAATRKASGNSSSMANAASGCRLCSPASRSAWMTWLSFIRCRAKARCTGRRCSWRTRVSFCRFPSMGSWVTYGLGSENENLPAFVVLPDPRGLSARWRDQLGRRISARGASGHGHRNRAGQGAHRRLVRRRSSCRTNGERSVRRARPQLPASAESQTSRAAQRATRNWRPASPPTNSPRVCNSARRR